MSQGLTNAVSGAAARTAAVASTLSLFLPAAPLIATYPITGTAPIANIDIGQQGKIAILEFDSTGCRVVMGSNLRINGDYLSTAGGTLMLVSTGSYWEEITRTAAIIQPYNAAPNGNFVGWQRPFTTGSQFTASPDGTQTADRWYTNRGGVAVWSVVRDTSVPAVAYNMPGAQYSYKINVTTPDVSLTGGDIYAFYHLLEGYDVQPLANGFAASWWAKAHRPGTYCFSFFNRLFDRSYITENLITAADTWQYFTAIVPSLPGTWYYDDRGSMYCTAVLGTGTTYGSGLSANAWLNSLAYSTPNQINGVAAVTDTFSLWGLNVVPGTVPQPFNPMPLPLQMNRLYRYYESWQASPIYDYGYHLASSYNIKHESFKVPKGGVPSMVLNATNQLGNGAMGLQAIFADNYSWIMSWASSGNYGFTLGPTAEWNPA